MCQILLRIPRVMKDMEMKGKQKRLLATTLSIISLALSAVCAGEEVLTFFGWSNQHVQTDGDGRHLIPAIEAMNTLPGTKYPAHIGGRATKPEFVLGCGDITEWPTTAAKRAYDELITKRLKFPSYDIIGNRDEGGKVPSETMKRWVIARHGSLTYTFDFASFSKRRVRWGVSLSALSAPCMLRGGRAPGCSMSFPVGLGPAQRSFEKRTKKGGIHFIALFSKYDESLNSPAQPITKEALDFICKDLAKLPKGNPVVVAMHLCFDALTNRQELVEAFGDANIILVLGGHYHKAKVDKYRGINFVQLPSPAPNSPNEFTVIRITSDRLVAIPYDYEKKEWDTDPRKTLDVPIKGPRTSR